jgi:ABC-type multidrug transport system permease subunit
MKLLHCMKKNLKVLFRSRLTVFVIILAPLLLFLLLHMAYNTSDQYSISIGLYSDLFSDTSNSIAASLEDTHFSVIIAKSRQDCIGGVEGGRLNTCVIFPENMSIGHHGDFIEIFVDRSKNNIVWIIEDIINTRIMAYSYELSLNLTASMLDQIAFIETQAEERLDEAKKALRESEQAANATSSAIAGLSKMDFSYNDKQLSIQPALDQNKLLKTNLANIASKVQYLISELSYGFGEIEDELLALSMEGTELGTIVNSTKVELTDAAKAIELHSNQTNTTRLKLSENIEAIGSSIKTIKGLIQNNSELRKSISPELTASVESIEATAEQLGSISRSLDSILAGLSHIKIREAEEIIQPFELKLVSITPASSQLSLLFPQFLGILILFISLLISTMMSSNERHSDAETRQRLTPVFKAVYLLAMYLTNLLILLFQVGIILLITRLFLIQNLSPHLFGLFITVFLASSAFIMLGIFLGQMFSQSHNAVLASVLLTSCLLFLSDIILPLESMPKPFFSINSYNPFVITIFLLRKTIFHRIPIAALLGDYMVLALVWVLCFLLSFVFSDIIRKERVLKLFSRVPHKRRTG